MAEGSHGHAPTVHWDALISGRQLCKLAHKAIAARIVQNIQYVSTAVLLPRHRANSNTGIMTRMSRRLSRRLLAVTSGLSGSAQNAATSGKVRLHNVRGKTAVALNAVKLILLETNTNTQHLKQHNTHCRLNGITTVHWVCHKCPKGEVHRYQMTPLDRTRTRGSGCPYCAGKQACKCNSLETHHPVILSEWDFELNDMTPADVTARSHKVVWWKNSLRGSWKQRIDARTHY